MSLIYKTYAPFKKYPHITIITRRDKIVLRYLRYRLDLLRERIALWICPWTEDFLDDAAKVGIYYLPILGTEGGSERVRFGLLFTRGYIRPFLALRWRGRYYHPFS